jgi:hypothetical protein
MYRLYHNQTVAGAILVDDIDDGLPNKVVHRLGATGNPDAYERDGYANKPKQPCYVPRTQASTGNPLVPGYIDLSQTPRVVLSAGKGKIKKLQQAGLVTVASVLAADVQTPVLTGASLAAGILTLTGVTLLSVAPDTTTVVITGTSAVTLTQAQITGGSGTVGATSIVIPAALITGVAVGTSSVKVVANAKSSNVLALAAPPTLTTAVKPVGGTLTLTGTNFAAPLTVVITGTGAISLTNAQITGGTGTISGTSIAIPNALVPAVVVGSSAKVTTSGGSTAVVTVT